MTIPNAGWYPDPENAQQDRWWNGVGWSEQRKVRSDAGLVGSGANIPAPSHIAGSPYGPAVTQAPQAPGTSATFPGEAAETRRMNNAAYLGLVLSVAAYVVNPLAIVSILGIVLSSRGLAQAGDRAATGEKSTGRIAALTGLILGIVVTARVGFTFMAGLG